MINPFLKNLNKIEFVVTNACTGKCIHCSQGEHSGSKLFIKPEIAADSVEKICSLYDIKTVMAFGGEPLLYPESVYAIMNAATMMNVEKRQVITNGYFSSRREIVVEVAGNLAECGVNELLLSVDAFHQRTIPLEAVKSFALELKKYKVPVKLQPAWLVSNIHDNVYNRKTREILDEFVDEGIYENKGNIIFPEGNALRYLNEYFKDTSPENPYVEDPFDVKCVSFSPNGDVLSGNVYKDSIEKILERYMP